MSDQCLLDRQNWAGYKVSSYQFAVRILLDYSQRPAEGRQLDFYGYGEDQI